MSHAPPDDDVSQYPADLDRRPAVSEPRSPELDLVQLVRVIRKRWRWIAGVTAAFTVLGVAYALMSTPYYRAEAVLLPRDKNATSGLSGQLSQFAGLAGLAGISVGSTDKQEPLGVLRSRGFARRFIEENNLLGVLVGDSRPTAILMTGNPDASNDIRRVVDRFSRTVMAVSEDKKSGLVVLSITWKDPELAAAWANKIVKQVNDEMRRRALQESEANIRYLQAQLAKTDVVSIRQSISSILETEMQKAMLAQGTAEYAFRVIDPAVPPALRARPKRALIVLLGLSAGLVFSILVALLAGPAARLAAAARHD